MHRSTLEQRLHDELKDFQLLRHPWYVRWENGELSREELRDYAEQYRHFEVVLPEVLSEVVGALPTGRAKDFVADNLADETATPTHVELFDQYIDALNGRHDAVASPAMTNLVQTYKRLAATGPVQGLSAVMAYEVQAAGIAESKGAGLRRHYGLTQDETTFWDVHSTLDVDHATWSIDGLAEVAEDIDATMADVRRAAESWWSFLDEREHLHA